jgi:hypothetical protein
MRVLCRRTSFPHRAARIPVAMEIRHTELNTTTSKAVSRRGRSQPTVCIALLLRFSLPYLKADQTVKVPLRVTRKVRRGRPTVSSNALVVW